MSRTARVTLIVKHLLLNLIVGIGLVLFSIALVLIAAPTVLADSGTVASSVSSNLPIWVGMGAQTLVFIGGLVAMWTRQDTRHELQIRELNAALKRHIETCEKQAESCGRVRDMVHEMRGAKFGNVSK